MKKTITFILAICLCVFAIPLFVIAFSSDSVDGCIALSIILLAFNLAVATSIKGGFDSFFLWLLVYMLPIIALTAIILIVNEVAMWDINGAALSTIAALIAIGFHILLMYLCPHFAHAFHAYPELLDKEYGPKQAICYCGEELQVDQLAGDLIHANSCEKYNVWKPNKSSILMRNENYHWYECSCGIKLGAFEGYIEHDYRGGICSVCGWQSPYSTTYDYRAKLYLSAEDHLKNGNLGAAALTFAKCGSFSNAKQRYEEVRAQLDKYHNQTIIVNRDWVIWVNENGTVSESYEVYP